jgi:hypothetical protein
MKIDKEWFNELIRKSPFKSQRQLAKNLKGKNNKPIDPGALSLMLNGRRSMQLHEAKQLAELLNVSLTDVLKHSGIALSTEGRSIPVLGRLDSKGNLQMDLSKEPEEFIEGPNDLPPGAIAVRVTSGNFSIDVLDGWILFAEKPDVLSPDMFGRLCLVQSESGAQSVAFVTRGYKSGLVNLMKFGGQNEENVNVHWASPVLWVKPQR